MKNCYDRVQKDVLHFLLLRGANVASAMQKLNDFHKENIISTTQGWLKRFSSTCLHAKDESFLDVSLNIDSDAFISLVTKLWQMWT